jgi:non-ribosomal peptide synthetase component F
MDRHGLVPLNPDHPPHRLNHMIGDAGIRCVLTDTRLEDRIPGFTGPLLMFEIFVFPENKRFAGILRVASLHYIMLRWDYFRSG